MKEVEGECEGMDEGRGKRGRKDKREQEKGKVKEGERTGKMGKGRERKGKNM